MKTFKDYLIEKDQSFASLKGEDISFNGVTQHDNGDMSYNQGPLSIRKNKDGSSDTTATIGDTTARVQQSPIGIKTMTAQGPAADSIIGVDASAERKGVDPKKFAAFQQQNPAVKENSELTDILRIAGLRKDYDLYEAGPTTTVDDEGNTTITRDDGSSMVIDPTGKQVMPGSNPNLPQNQGFFNTIGNWFQDKGEFQKPGGWQPGTPPVSSSPPEVKPERAVNPGSVPAAASTPPVYTPGPVQQASQGRANDDATRVDAAVTRAEIERAEAAAAAANKPPAPVKPGIDWSKGKEEQPLTYKPPGIDWSKGKEEQPLTYKPPGTTPATTPGTTPATTPGTTPATTDPKKSQTRKEIKDLLAKLKGGGGAEPGPIDQRPVPSGNKIEAMQKELLAAGANLGTFGPNGDGVDGKIGNKTREAMKKFPAIAAKYGAGGTPAPAQTGQTTPTSAPANSKNDEIKKQIANLIGQLKGKPDTTPINIPTGANFPPPFRTPPTVGESVNLEDDRILNQIKNVRF